MISLIQSVAIILNSQSEIKFKFTLVENADFGTLKRNMVVLCLISSITMSLCI